MKGVGCNVFMIRGLGSLGSLQGVSYTQNFKALLLAEFQGGFLIQPQNNLGFRV